MRSALHVDRLLQHVVGRGDHLGAGAVGALRDDQLGELRGNIDVGAFHRFDHQVAGAVGAGLLGQRRARLVGGGERLAILALQLVGVVEGDQRHLRDSPRLTVVVVHDHVAIGLHGDRGERARRYAVLCQSAQQVIRTGILRQAVGTAVGSQVQLNGLLPGAEIGVEL
jgi:hypothetical protein